MLVIMKDSYDQIMIHHVVKDSYTSTVWLKTTHKAFTFNYLHIDDKWYFHDDKRLNVLQELCNKVSILKPDKGQGIVLINHDDYINSFCKIFDSTKFKKLTKGSNNCKINNSTKLPQYFFKGRWN